MSLEALIKERIRKDGPLSVAEYMALALSHPEYGYYMRKDPLGPEGDFTTAPEISQIFGELVGAWLAGQWLAQGKPQGALVELGPGRGTLMVDLLRATKHIAGFHDAVSVHLVETSPALKAKQWQALAGKHPHLHWHERVDELPQQPLFLIANEFFDALPIRQFVGEEERKIAVDKSGTLQFTLPASDSMRETCEAGAAIMRDISGRIAAHGGAGLVIDYGYEGGQSDTLQAVCQHQYYDVLKDPGEADLTAHVDFEALAQGARQAGAAVYGPVGQGSFLTRLGATLRASRLSENAAPPQKNTLLSGLDRLISINEMGELFKVLGITKAGQYTPDGF